MAGLFAQSSFQRYQAIQETQDLLKLMLQNQDKWPSGITNGTIMVLDKFYQSQIDKIPFPTNAANALLYKLIHGPDYAIIRYSVGHAIDFLQGMQQFIGMFDAQKTPALLSGMLSRIQLMMAREEIKALIAVTNKQQLSAAQHLHYGYYLLYHFKNQINDLIDMHGRLEAYLSLAKAIQVHQLTFPDIQPAPAPSITAKGLRHILLEHPTAYDLEMNQETNFIFLTGANMAGKSTFIKAVGVAAYLAHIGMAVPATQMQLSIFDGILSNIQVSDNIVKGESYFFNEVQRIKNTITRINDNSKWLVLIDELFKGTNVQDAMRCSTTVIKGLLKIKNSLFVLSTHLYEIGDELRPYPNIAFRYFETQVTDEELSFSYQLKEGISNDRLGYLILKREGVVEMIERL